MTRLRLPAGSDAFSVAEMQLDKRFTLGARVTHLPAA